MIAMRGIGLISRDNFNKVSTERDRLAFDIAQARETLKQLTIANEKQDMTINSFRGIVHVLETVVRDAMPLFQGHLVHELSRTEWLVRAHCALGERTE